MALYSNLMCNWNTWSQSGIQWLRIQIGFHVCITFLRFFAQHEEFSKWETRSIRCQRCQRQCCGSGNGSCLSPLMRIRIRISRINRLIFHTFWLVICQLVRIRVQLITSGSTIKLITMMRIRIQLITLMRIRILPFYLMRIRISNTG